jgi:NADH:ubiquinone oxidoreductase subunit 6 (subunit J)
LVVAIKPKFGAQHIYVFCNAVWLAGLYVLALADFVAVTQIVIYVGGILVLILFAFMLSGRETLATAQQQTNRFISLNNLPALLLAALFLVVMINVVFKADVNNLPWVKIAIETKNVVPVNGTDDQQHRR